jgi:hypothetical protein
LFGPNAHARQVESGVVESPPEIEAFGIGMKYVGGSVLGMALAI